MQLSSPRSGVRAAKKGNGSEREFSCLGKISYSTVIAVKIPFDRMKIQFERKKAHDGSPFFPTKLKINQNLKTPMKKSKISSECLQKKSVQPTNEKPSWKRGTRNS